jgi:hypothetical protein
MDIFLFLFFRGLALVMAVGVSSLGYAMLLGLLQQLEGESAQRHRVPAAVVFVEDAFA